ncbi:SAM-dependent methyltransferase [Cryptosporangium aurantiacum]|uniref:SAM-dependent methyltransferase, MidA family n=1 Tax=Cryptosporangium aurantiacum TaxID=134849 RepID=A0A1M7NBK5_9ACTN|nr:SAM-dependent methyltransferase [Cryptosporangium aurantiacum]SHN01026.1 SAM-dependent methyltransferase, MidA family [Cryptosporangium aurantiacum]
MLVPWREAAQDALYGPGGFYLSTRPALHFRTSVHAAADLFADAIGALLERVDAALGRPDPIDLVDVGAGGGELLSSLGVSSELGRRVRLTAVERGPRPSGLVPGVGWASAMPPVTGLLVANEWLDNVPVDVVSRDADGVDRIVLVDPATGAEELGPPVSGAEAAWMARWWPLEAPGDRAEIGAPRDAAWASAVAQVSRGLAVAVDYGHEAGSRPVGGTLTGYRDGRQVPPVPDGSCDLTAHVAIDAVAAASGPGAVVRRQREVLRGLGVSGGLPPRELASTDPAGYLRALSTATRAAELTAPTGLGSFFWLFNPKNAKSVRF